jgi:hypothetical protein
MKVKDLIMELQALNPDSEVILQKDAEGNDYSPLEGVDSEAVYIPKNTYSGVVYSLHWTAEESDMDKKTWESIKKKQSCVVLFPIN